jgi:O-antigen/teichoic acid export membrane protein
MLEILVANGEAVRSTMIYRLVLPVCVVLPLLAIWLSPIELTVGWAVASFGLAWLVSFLFFRRLALRSMPKDVMTAERVLEPRLWLKRSAPFLIHSVMMTQFASLGIVGLELLGSGEHNVAVFAAAIQTGTFVVLLATATNRLYGPAASLLIERRDYPGMIAMIRERHGWIIPATLVYFATMVVFGRSILRLFGPEFTEGFAALCWIVAGASVSVWFAMAPNYLKFVQMNHTVLGITAAAGGLNMLLLVVLGSRLGATGAGAAYGISLAAMSITFYVLARRASQRIMRS